MSEQADKATHFRRMHHESLPLLLPNAWDAMSARLFEDAGYAAVATTSAGVAWSLGCADGERLSRAEVVAATARIARALRVPVTADIEGGFGANPDEVAETVTAIIEAGAVGVNIEDSLPGPAHTPRGVEDAAARIRAARTAADAAGVPIVINARTDAYLHGSADAPERFEQTMQRGRAYLAAGADCIYAIGVSDAPTIARLVRALEAPLNVWAKPGMPDPRALGALGVARVSTATALALHAYAHARRAAAALLAGAGFDVLASDFGHPQAQALMDA